MNKSKTIYSVFSGTFYELPEKDVKILDIGQIPLKRNQSASCNKCYGRGQIGRDMTNFSYQICKCVRKNIDFDLIKSLLPETKID
jgi:hypothetical protein